MSILAGPWNDEFYKNSNHNHDFTSQTVCDVTSFLFHFLVLIDHNYWHLASFTHSSFYRRQTKFVKAMFLHLSVCPRGHALWWWWGACMVVGGACMAGGAACMAGGHVWQGGMFGRGCAWQGACVAGGQHAWQGGAWHACPPNRYYEIR